MINSVRMITNKADLENEVNLLIDAHPEFAQALAACQEYPPLRKGKAGFAGLSEIIISQQISKSAANSIFARLQQHSQNIFGIISPKIYQGLSEETKRGVGLSRPKIRYLDSLANAFLEGTLHEEQLGLYNDEELIKTLTKLSGVGRWSAEIYALFVLGRSDIFPAADLALQESYRRLMGLKDRPKEKQFRAMTAPYAPYRSAAARLLWHSYRAAPIA